MHEKGPGYEATSVFAPPHLCLNIFLVVVWHNTVLQCGKKWAWPSKHFLACAACGLVPPRSKNPSYAPETC